ncbi:hypothetical protein ACLKA6_001958 [Drosophila palustris]
MAGWYQKFIRGYASLTSPLTDALKHKKHFEWSEDAEKSFQTLKAEMCKAPVLHTPNFEAPFFIHCDASHTGVGGVLMQVNEENDEVPIAYMSRKLNKCQRNYSVTEKECFAAILSIKKFRPYVEGHAFTVITDHASLKWLMSQSDLSTRLARWALKLQAYTFEIQHRKGSKNIVPDALSRTYTEDLSAIKTEQIIDLQSPHFQSKSYTDLATKITQNNNQIPDLKGSPNNLFICTQAIMEGRGNRPLDIISVCLPIHFRYL